MSATPDDVARWMLKEVRTGRVLEREEAVGEIKARFGEDFVYDNYRGTTSVGRRVLKRLREIAGDEIVWASRSRYWRTRAHGDDPGYKQDE